MAFPVLLDTCALYPIGLADLLLRLAEQRTYRPLWSRDILVELERNLREKTRLSASQARYRIDQMRASFPGAEVEDYEGLNQAMSCHPKDAHVLAAAVRANAELIVTFNLGDFPVPSLKPYEIDAVHPDDFLLDQLDLYPERTLNTLLEQAMAYQDPRVTVHELLIRLEKTGLPRFVERVLTSLPEVVDAEPSTTRLD